MLSHLAEAFIYTTAGFAGIAIIVGLISLLMEAIERSPFTVWLICVFTCVWFIVFSILQWGV